MNTNKKIITSLGFVSAMAALTPASATVYNNQYNRGGHDISAAEGVWKEERYQRGPIRKMVIDKLTNRHHGDRFRVSIWGDCDKNTCFRTGKVLENRNGKMKISYGKGNRKVILKVSKLKRQLMVQRKVKRNGIVVRTSTQYLKRKARLLNGGHLNTSKYNTRRADLKISYATGRWNERLRCYEVTATVRNVGNRYSTATAVRATGTRNGYRISKQTKIAGLAPGASTQVRLVMNRIPYKHTRVEVNPGRYVKEYNYRNNVKYVKNVW